MSQPIPIEPESDEFLAAVESAIEGTGMSIMPDDEFAAWMDASKQAIAAADEQAKADGKRFLDEETDRAIIDDWYKGARAVTTVEQAAQLMRHLNDAYRHDYGTICHAVAAGALAGAYASGASEITGFQAGAIFWEFSRHWMQWGDEPRRLVDYSDLLYPQSDHKFTEISPKTAEWLQTKAAALIAERSEHVHPNVLNRWQMLADGDLPPFVKVETS